MSKGRDEESGFEADDEGGKTSARHSGRQSEDVESLSGVKKGATQRRREFDIFEMFAHAHRSLRAIASVRDCVSN